MGAFSASVETTFPRHICQFVDLRESILDPKSTIPDIIDTNATQNIRIFFVSLEGNKITEKKKVLCISDEDEFFVFKHQTMLS